MVYRAPPHLVDIVLAIAQAATPGTSSALSPTDVVPNLIVRAAVDDYNGATVHTNNQHVIMQEIQTLM